MNYFLVTLFFVALESVSPKPNSDIKIKSFESLELHPKLIIKSDEESKKKLQQFIKNKLIENRQIPETATVNIDTIYLDKSYRDLFAGQRYLVKSFATWTTFYPHKCKIGLYILKMNKHNDFFTTQVFDNNLEDAKVKLGITE